MNRISAAPVFPLEMIFIIRFTSSVSIVRQRCNGDL
jgi:hypothetical protein